MAKYAEKLTAMIKAAGQDIIDRAEEFVGGSELIKDVEIHLYFPADGSFPELECVKKVVPKHVMEIIRTRK